MREKSSEEGQAAAVGRRVGEPGRIWDVLRGCAENLLSAAEDFAGYGQNGAGAAVPFGYAVEAEAGGRGVEG